MDCEYSMSNLLVCQLMLVILFKVNGKNNFMYNKCNYIVSN